MVDQCQTVELVLIYSSHASLSAMKEFNYFKKATAFVGAAALTSLLSLPVLAQTTPRPTTPNNRAPQSTVNPQRGTATAPTALDREFVMMAARGNNAEIQTSQLALQKSSNQTVRSYAQQMVREHTQANQRLSQVAAQHGISLPTDPGPLNAAIAQQLAQLSGTAFDRAYMATQENLHMQAIALYRTAVQQGKAGDVKQYASALLPSINSHYQMANRAVAQNGTGNTQMPLQ
jgi:putative membrane protein